jgi:hypothetical protein
VSRGLAVFDGDLELHFTKGTKRRTGSGTKWNELEENQGNVFLQIVTTAAATDIPDRGLLPSRLKLAKPDNPESD